MKNLMTGAAGLVLLAGAAMAQTAYWNFNTGAASGAAAALPLSANIGTGTLTSNGVPASVVQFGGTTLNAVGADPAGQDLAMQNGTNGANIGAWFEFNFSTLGVMDIVMSVAERTTATGSTAINVQYWDGGAFQTAQVFNPARDSVYGVRTFDLSALSVLDNNANARVRLVFTGGTASSSAGNTRIDNVQFNGVPIPTPGAAALAGIAGVFGLRRRR